MGTLTILFVYYVALPFGVSWYLPHRAAQHGVDLEVTWAQIKPFESKLLLSDVRIGTTAGMSVEWSRVEVEVDLTALLSGRFVFGRFRLSDATLLASVPQAGEADVTAAIPSAPPAAVHIGEFVIDTIELATLSKALGQLAVIDRLRIASLDDAFQPDGSEIEVDLSIGTGYTTLRGRLALDAMRWILDVNVDAREVPLTTLPGFDGNWRGKLDGFGPVRFVYAPATGAFSATAGGRWAVKRLQLMRSEVVVSGLQVIWDGTAFVAFSGDVMEGFGMNAELSARTLEVEIGDGLRIETEAPVLRMEASQAAAPALSMAGKTSAVRMSGGAGTSAAFEAEATHLVSRATLTFTEEFGIIIDRLQADALTVKLPADQSIDVERPGFDRIIVASNPPWVQVAAATTERIEWWGGTAPQSSATVTGLVVEEITQRRDGPLRFVRASAEVIDGDINGDGAALDLSLRDIVLDPTAFSSTGIITTDGARAAQARLGYQAHTAIMEQVALAGVVRDANGVVEIASGYAGTTYHTAAETQTVMETGLQFSAATVTDRTWKTRYLQLERLNIVTGAAHAGLRELELVDVTGTGEHTSARIARLGALEHKLAEHRIALEGLLAISPVWHGSEGSAQAIEAASGRGDTAGQYRWESSGWTLTEVETGGSGQASAATVSVDALTIGTAYESAYDAVADTEHIKLTRWAFDGASTMQASQAAVARLHYRGSDDFDADIRDLQTDALQWHDGELATQWGAASRIQTTTAAVQMSFDAAEITFVQVGIDGSRRLGTLTAGSHQGWAEPAPAWSTGPLKLGGYLASASGETRFDTIEARDLVIRDTTRAVPLRVDLRATPGEHIDSSAATTALETARVDRTVPPTAEPRSASVQALQAQGITMRGSTLAITALDLSAIAGTVGLNEDGGWELPVPAGMGDARSPFRLRLDAVRAGGLGSQIHFFDRTTDPETRVTLDLTSATLHAFNSGATDAPGRFTVTATAGPAAILQAHGALVPTSAGLDLDLDARIRGIALPELSPYVRQYLDLDLTAGRADMTLELATRASALEGRADLTMHDMVLGTPRPSADAPSLAAALASLEDAQGVIGLKVPFHDQTDDPDFHLAGLLARALADTVLQAAAARPKVQ